MGIFTRFRDIVSSNINSMLDKAEDPEKMIKLMIHEMEDTLIELKSSCAGVIAGRKKIQRRAEEIVDKKHLWEHRAELAVGKNRDDLAREALTEKRRYSQVAETLENEINEHSILIEQYKKDIIELGYVTDNEAFCLMKQASVFIVQIKCRNYKNYLLLSSTNISLVFLICLGGATFHLL